MAKGGKRKRQNRGEDEEEAEAGEGVADEWATATGLCPCAQYLKHEPLNHGIGSGAPLARGECEVCAKSKPSGKKQVKAKAGRKEKKGNKRRGEIPDDDDTEGGSGPVMVCLGCGFIGCRRVHASQHYAENRGRKKGKTTSVHSVFLSIDHVTLAGLNRAFCFACNLPIQRPQFVLDDAGLSERYEGAYPVDEMGYVIDVDDELGPLYDKCCGIVVKSMKDVKVGEDDSGWVTRRGRKRGKASHGDAVALPRGRQVAAAAARAGLKGLTNLGNTCFLNATMQAVAATPGLRDTIACVNLVSMPLTVSTLAFLLKMTDSAVDNVTAQLRALLTEVQRKGPQFRGNDQHDAQEYLRFLMNGVEVEFSSVHKAMDFQSAQKENPFHVLFGGVLGSTTTCGKCFGRTTTEEVCYDISVPLRRTLTASLDAFFEVEELEDCKYLCSTCNRAAFDEHQQRLEQRRREAIEAALQDAQGREEVQLADLMEARESDDEEVVEEGEEEEEDEEDEDEAEPPPSSSPSPAPAGDVEEDLPPPKKLFTTATKQYHVFSPPRTLSIHFKRFAFSLKSMAYEKDTRVIDLPDVISLDRYMDSSWGDKIVPPEHRGALAELTAMFPECKAAPAVLAQTGYDFDMAVQLILDSEGETGARGSGLLYELFAIVEHRGAIGYGHYVAYVRKGSGWYECNDGWVSEVAEGTAKKACCYMALYARR